MERIGGTLRAIRRQLKLTLREVQERSRIFSRERGDDSYQISAGWLSRLEQEENRLTVNKLIVLAHVYNVLPEQLLGTALPGRSQPPDETALLAPADGPSPEPYKWGIIGKHDRTLQPLVPAGSIVQIDTLRRVIPANQDRTHALQRPIYFLKAGDAYFCGWCEFDQAGQLLTLVPHPLSPASSRSWKYPEEVQIIGRVVAMSIRVFSIR